MLRIIKNSFKSMLKSSLFSIHDVYTYRIFFIIGGINGNGFKLI